MFKFRVKLLGILVFFDLKQDIDKARVMELIAKSPPLLLSER